MKDHVFHRDFKKTYPIITHAKGIYLYDKNGKSYLDGSSGAIAANLGHGNEMIASAIAEQAKKAAFVHTLRFETDVLHQLSKMIAELTPDALEYVYFTTGGSEANESAMKLARQYHRDRGNKEKHIVIGRWQSYHGNTLGSLSVGGDIKRRKPFTPMLAKYEHIYSPYCERCPYNYSYDKCKVQGLQCVYEIEKLIEEIGEEFISSIIIEPIVGSQQGSVVPPNGYLEQVRELCNKYDILLIIDEVMTGFGRTGTHFAFEHFNVIPDIVTFGKGVSGGYAPLAGMVVHNRIVKSLIEHSDGKFAHGFTYSGHPVALAAGVAAIKWYQNNNILENCKKMSQLLFQKLEDLKAKHQIIGQIRGKGLLIGLELLKDHKTDQHFLPEENAAEKLNQLCIKNGLVLYPGSGSIDGKRGEHILVAPPLTVKEEEVETLVQLLDQSLTLFEEEMIVKK